MSNQSPHRGLHSHIRHLEKTGIGLLTASGFGSHQATEIEIALPSGRPAFLQLNATERGMLVNVHLPKAWVVPLGAQETTNG